LFGIKHVCIAIRQGGVQMQEQLAELDEMEAHHWFSRIGHDDLQYPR
jgi:hypothetical protein